MCCLTYWPSAFLPSVFELSVVGHTMAYCYDPRRPDVHPPLSSSECNLGLVRASENLQASCVDGGMYVGARAFLEIGVDAHFRTYQQYQLPAKDPDYAKYQVKDLTNIACV